MFQVGDKVTWMYEPKGGYGYITPVAAKVLKVTSKRVQIEVTQTRRGFQEVNETVQKWVTPERLRK